MDLAIISGKITSEPQSIMVKSSNPSKLTNNILVNKRTRSVNYLCKISEKDDEESKNFSLISGENFPKKDNFQLNL